MPFLWIGLVAALYSVMVFDFSDGFGDWANTFMATLLSVFAGIFLYRHQTARADEDRRERLLMALSVEIQVTLKILGERKPPFLTPSGEASSSPIVEVLPTTVLEETLRSGLYDPDSTGFLVQLLFHLRAHNEDVGHYWRIQLLQEESPGPLDGVAHLNRMEQRLETIKENCRNMLRYLEEQDLPQPKTPIHSENSSTTK